MSTVDSTPSPQPSKEDATVWLKPLIEFLLSEEGVAAVNLEPSDKEVSLAMLGSVDEKKLQQRLNGLLEELDDVWNKTTSTPAGSAKHDESLITLSLEGDVWRLQKQALRTAQNEWKWRRFEWPDREHHTHAHDHESKEKNLGDDHGHGHVHSHGSWQTLAWQSGICGVALAAGWLLERYTSTPHHWVTLCFLAAIIAGGWDAAQEVWENVRHGRFDVHFLMLAVAVGAASIGAWEEGAFLLFLFSTAGALEQYVMQRTRREIDALTRSAPKHAHVLLSAGGTEDRSVDELTVGEKIEIRPDETFPLDGEVISGETAADESTLTGESIPIEKKAGSPVYGGTLNQWGRVTVKVTHLARESTLQRIITLIQHAQHLKAPSQRFSERFGTGYTLTVLASVVVMFFVWLFIIGLPAFQSTPEQASAFYRAMTLLVVMSPCALALSVPSAILAGIAWGARRGILFRGGFAIEKLVEVDTIAMDKTGTLTAGDLQVKQVDSFPPGKETEILQTAVNLESSSNHPIARAITAHAISSGLKAQELVEFKSIAGQGLRGRTAQGVGYVGRRELIEQSALGDVLKSIPDAPLGFSEVWVLQGDTVGRILLQDRIREGSRPVLKELAVEGIKTIMLTGDRRAAAVEVARELGIQDVRAGLKPEDKVAAVHELGQQGYKVAMVGDGVNDAPCLAAAYVSVAMGARGSDAALEQSDVVLMQDKIEKLLSARLISQRARRVIYQNLAISLGSVALMGLTSLFSQIPLSIGVLAHEGSTVVVCLNSLRLLFVKEKW